MENILHNLSPKDLENVESFPRISYSEANSWTRCQRQWQYQYGMGYVRGETPTYFSKGHYLHGLMANLLEGTPLDESHDLTIKAIQEDDESFSPDSIAKDVDLLKTQAMEVTQDILVGNEVVGLEKEFYYRPEGEDFLVHGFVDAILRNSHGELWIVDFKTAGRRWSEAQFLLSTQDILYAGAVSACMDEMVQGATYVIFAPTGIDFKTRRVTPEGMGNVLEDIRRVEAERRNSARAPGNLPMSPLWGCGGCPFQQACRMYVAGGDVQYILESNFVVDDERIERTRINLGT